MMLSRGTGHSRIRTGWITRRARMIRPGLRSPRPNRSAPAWWRGLAEGVDGPELVNTIDPKIVAASFGMNPAGVTFYLADHVDDSRMP
ncbi:MAG TPA: hypothetical protein VI365_04335 [Trebonia sp.]